ncbi:threonine/serine dehydratase [Frankia sp. CNm7]|uniref:threonine ammonia-lyase n=1 Tax=Frankia nepalensis TaxID=1836974 RepID=UPI001DACC91F|nr:threonine/serine dehydratase [Frankia nepalensis]MBL7514981.1 threonine/serine dehydratase [Frankia nepalensis]MBL7518660.1 threonine/serine dehydratase [Frankia nepalensis]
MPAPPEFVDVLRARQRIAPYLRETPLFRYPQLDAAAEAAGVRGAALWVKHENHQPVGAFKVRGGVNLAAALPDEERARGFAAASTGNHGQSVAYAARVFGTRAVIVVPENANPVKVESMRALGAEVLARGATFDDARRHAAALAADERLRFVDSGDEPLLIAGVATCTLEILETQPDLDAIVVPVGSGTGVVAAGLVARTVDPGIEVIGVQSAAAPAAHRSWQSGALVDAPMGTAVEGVATGSPFALPQAMMRALLDDFVLVSDDAIHAATRLMIEKTRNLVEPAGAAPLAAVLADPARFAGRRVALVCSGGNISPAQLGALFAP